MHILNKEEVLGFVREREDLFDAAGHTNPFSCSAWVLHFIEQIATDDWVFFVPEYCTDGESLMLLYSKRGEPRRLMGLTNYYSSLYSPLISSSADRNAALSMLVRQLVEPVPPYSIIDLAPLDQSTPELVELRTAFAQYRWYVKEYFCFGNWYLPCTNLSFHEYMRQRPSQLYNTWLRKSKKFSPGQDARLEIITDPSETDAAMEAYERVYARSWKKPEPYSRFVQGWAKLCARNGWLRLGIAWVGDVPIAVQFWFTMHRRAYIFKLAYDEEYAKWSAGTMLTAHMVKWSFEQDHVIEIDYLTGDDAYKRFWMTARRERIGVRACNLRSASGAIMAAIEVAGTLRRRWRPPTRLASATASVIDQHGE